MPKPIPQVALELESGSYLIQDGSVIPNVPPGTRVISAAPGTSLLLGASGGTMPAGGLTKPLGDESGLWDNLAKTAGLSDALKNALSQSADIITIVSGAYSAYQAVITVLEMGGLIDAKNNVDPVAAAIFQATFADSAMTHKRDVANFDGNVIVAASAVKSYLQSPAPNTRADVVSAEHDCKAACASLSLLPFFEVLSNPGEYFQADWIWDQGWLDIPSWVRGSVPPDPPVFPFADQPASKGRFDYRFTMASLSFALATRIAMMRVIEPEFRSTGRFRAEIQSLSAALGPILRKWQQSIQRTWNPLDGGFPVSTFGSTQPNAYGGYIPVGAVDVCSGTEAWLGLYVPAHDSNASPDDPAFWTDGFTEFNLWPPKAQSRYLSDANNLRHSAREHVLETSGCKQFTALAASLAVLATDPDSSETVTISAKSGIQPGVFVLRWTDTGREEREVKGIACERRTFTAEVWEGPAVLNLHITTQTPESRNSFLIPYRYFLATGGGSVELHQGGPPVTLNASHFDAERGPNGEKRNVARGFSPVTIPYTLTPAPSSTTLSLSLPPGIGNVTFALDVEETIQSGRVYSTGRSCELVTRELRLPAEYFAYRKECEKRANKLLVDLNRRFAISAAPGPRFDPRRETVVDYLARLSRTAPELVRDARANLPRQER